MNSSLPPLSPIQSLRLQYSVLEEQITTALQVSQTDPRLLATHLEHLGGLRQQSTQLRDALEDSEYQSLQGNLDLFETHIRQHLPQQLLNIRYGYAVLEDRVRRALRVHLGDEAQLSAQIQDVLRFLAVAEQHSEVFPASEFATIQSNIASILSELEDAKYISSDPPEAPPPQVTYQIRTGRPGRPRTEINRDVLAEALQLRPSTTNLTPTFKVCARTIRRRGLDYGLLQPGQPVRTTVVQADGTELTVYNAVSPRTLPVMLSDEELDARIAAILQDFPQFGRDMLAGRLRADGYRIPRARITASYLRVHGAPQSFGGRTIVRRQYKVAGANSLWHHDGQHGLIRYGLIIHCFVDGKSRVVTGIDVSNNNRSDTVLVIFHEARSVWGTPSRCRGDHGLENILVAAWMEEHRGSNRGSYIFGRSIYNTRIERLWFDVTRGFGQKWKNFFHDLELHYGLNPSNKAHIWLLHYLFLESLRRDAKEWADAWNNHSLQMNGQRERSPRDMFFFSLLHDGPRGLIDPASSEDPMSEEDIQAYGIDWEAVDDPALRAHFLANNPEDLALPANRPVQFSEVRVDPPPSFLTQEQLDFLEIQLQQRGVNRVSHNMNMRTTLWIEALQICNSMFEE